MKKKKEIIIGIALVIVLSVIGISYAYWNRTLVQTNPNVVTSACFEFQFQEDIGSGIHLEDSFPLTDTEGRRLKPYTFKVTNRCNQNMSYQMNLEMTNKSTMPEEYIKMMINEKTPFIINTKRLTSPTINNGKTAYAVENGVILAKETKEYEVRLWIDENVKLGDPGLADSVFESKVTFIVTYLKDGALTLLDTVKSLEPVTSGNGVYNITHEDANITYTPDEAIKENFKQTETRYAGVNPDNYVTFNGEEAGWRIIGAVNTPEGQRIKLIRATSIGRYSWDSSENTLNQGRGANEWSQADIMKVLNAGYENENYSKSAYWNRSRAECFAGQNNETTSCDFTQIGLIEGAKSMIDTITWNLGTQGEAANSEYQARQFYEYERSNNHGKTCEAGNYCNDNIQRTITWQGKVALPYVTDYGYATGSIEEEQRNTCIETSLGSWNGEEMSYCRNNNWLYEKAGLWTLTPYSSPTFAYGVFFAYGSGSVFNSNANYVGEVKPTIYLKPDVLVTSGTGAPDDPFELFI